MSRKKYAKALAKKGFSIFRLTLGKKTPSGKGWQKEAAADAKGWSNGQDYNIGVACGGGLLVVDIDMKKGVDGEAAWAALGIKESAFQVATPSGGRHLYYEVDEDVSNSASKIAEGVDIRGIGGYVVGPGSEVGGSQYTVINTGAKMMKAPKKLLALCLKTKPRDKSNHGLPVGELDLEENKLRAKEYLDVARESIDGAGGDANAFGVAARVRDMGVSEGACLDMMLGDWNARCQPPWTGDELAVKVKNAYAYAGSRIGVDTPEVQFADEPDSDDVVKRSLSAMDRMFQSYALVTLGTSYLVIEEYANEEGRPVVETYGEKAFHMAHVDKYYIDEETTKKIYLSRVWVMNEKRRTYHGFTFNPKMIGPIGRKYNHWRGFTYSPTNVGLDEAKKGCDKYLRHIRDVVCGGNVVDYKWIMNHFAQMIQTPWKKPETAMVVTGRKGAGKSLMFDVIGNLVRDNYVLTAEKRMMLGNFNSHMETVLVFQFEEAFWAGDKAAEGKLKLLITGKHHMIERKGYEPYMVGNFARIYITSNNDWVVPATVDERRFAVFACLDAMIGDKPYFNAIFTQLQANGGEGYRALMTVLSEWNVDQTLVHVPPKTQALADQKHETLSGVASWVFASLESEVQLGADGGFDEGEGWMLGVPGKELHEGYKMHLKEGGFKYPKPLKGFGIELISILGGACWRNQKHVDGKTCRYFEFKDLEKCREMYEKWFGHDVEW
tara:strand:- start:310 stop:2472 length:2163 start_codon:yes stop_codon:yes gene_type:complete